MPCINSSEQAEKESHVCMSKWDCNGTATPSPSGPEELEASPRRRAEKEQHSQERLMPLREKNGAIRAVFETETQQTEPDTSQWEGRALACTPETLTWSQGTAKPQLSFPKQG